MLSLSSLRFGGIGRGWTGRGVWGSPASLCQAVVAILSQARALVTTLLTARYALPTPPTIFTPNLPLAPGSLVMREGYRGGGGGDCERRRMVPIVSTAGPESAVSPGESIAIWAELAAKSFFLGCSCAQKKVYSSCKMFACAMCQHTHAACASVCVCTDLSPKQLLFFDCSTSIALPSFMHVAELLCEVSVAPKRLLLLWTDVRWCARVDKGTHAHNHRVILSQRFSRCSQSNYYRLP